MKGNHIMKTEEFRLPAHWATCLLYGDTTGLEEAEIDEASAWEVMCAPGPCIGVADDTDFDDGPGACERCTFTFQVIEPVLSDGEVIGYV
jgi:hypothetical protein